MSIPEAITRLNAMYEGHATHSYEAIASEVARIVAAFSVPDLKEVCRGFELRSNLVNKANMRHAIEHKITRRKSIAERPDASKLYA